MDLTQDLFVRLLEKGVLAEADPARGRFRAFLRSVCADFLANRCDRENALKRGGGRAIVPLDLDEAENRYACEPAHALTPERIFDRTWALLLLGRVLEQFREEYRAAGQSMTFEALSLVLTPGPHAVAYATLAARLGIAEGAVRVAVHRLPPLRRATPRGDRGHAPRSGRGRRRDPPPVLRTCLVIPSKKSDVPVTFHDVRLMSK